MNNIIEYSLESAGAVLTADGLRYSNAGGRRKKRRRPGNMELGYQYDEFIPDNEFNFVPEQTYITTHVIENHSGRATINFSGADSSKTKKVHDGTHLNQIASSLQSIAGITSIVGNKLQENAAKKQQTSEQKVEPSIIVEEQSTEKKDNTLLVVGISAVGILLIAGVIYVLSKKSYS